MVRLVPSGIVVFPSASVRTDVECAFDSYKKGGVGISFVAQFVFLNLGHIQVQAFLGGLN